MLSRLYGSLCLNSYVANTFILGDSCVRVKALRKSVTSSYKVNKEFCLKVFCTVLILRVCCLVFPLREARRKGSPACVCLFSSISSPFHIMLVCNAHEHTCFKKKKRFHSSYGALLVHLGNILIRSWSDFTCGPQREKILTLVSSGGR